MKIARILISLMLAVGVLAGVNHQVSAATTSSDGNCDLKQRFANRADNYVVKDGQVTVHFTVTGTGDCSQQVTVASWNAPNGTDGVPFESQTFVASKSGVFHPGNHSMTIALPKCFYQVDLLRGMSPFGPNGGVDYQDWQYVGSGHGGAACVTPTPTPATPAKAVPTELPNTGAGDVAAIFAATTIAGAVAYRLFVSRRLARQS